MRQILAALLALLLVAPHLPAHTRHDWGEVEKLTPEMLVTISLWNGDTLSGHVISANDSGLQLETRERRTRGTANLLREIDRTDIQKITRIPALNLPNPEKWMAAGALIGAGAGVTVGAVEDARQGNNGRWFLGGVAGAALGFFGSGVVLVSVGIGKSVPVLAHHVKLVYEAAATAASK